MASCVWGVDETQPCRQYQHPSENHPQLLAHQAPGFVKRTPAGKQAAIGAARGRYVRYVFCGESEAVLSRAESTTSHDPVFGSGGQHHLLLHS